jgi:hypothetical protein
MDLRIMAKAQMAMAPALVPEVAMAQVSISNINSHVWVAVKQGARLLTKLTKGLFCQFRQ